MPNPPTTAMSADTALAPDVPHQVIIIGGGIAGLTLAHDLAGQGLVPLVLEARSAVGGVVSGHQVGGFDLDAGAESYAIARPSVAELITELGMGEQVCAPNPAGAWLAYQGGAAPLPRGGWLGIPADPLAPDVVEIIGPAAARRAAADLSAPIYDLPTDLTLGALVRERLGAEVLYRLVEPVVGGVYSCDPDQLEIRAIAPNLPSVFSTSKSLCRAVAVIRGATTAAGSAVAGLNGGMNTMVTALSAQVLGRGGQIATDTTAVAISRQADGWTILTDNRGIPATLRCRQLVIATSTGAARHLLTPLMPAVDWAAVTTGTSVRLATLVVDQPKLDDFPRGTGLLVASDVGHIRAKALTHATAKWPWLRQLAAPGRHVLRLSYGMREVHRSKGSDAARAEDTCGARLPDIPGLPDIALADAQVLLGVPLTRTQLVDFASVTWTDVQAPATPGRTDAVTAIREAADGLGQLSLAGSWVAGTGLAAVIAQARQVAHTITKTEVTIQ